jgi:hypothetical protein
MLKKISDRAKFDLSQFGLVFALFFLILHFVTKSRQNLFIYVSIALLIVTLFFYRVLSPLNRLWRKLGDILGRIIGSVILGVVFYIMLTPIALLKRLLGNRPADIDFSLDKNSFWIIRKNKEVSGKDFEQQF